MSPTVLLVDDDAAERTALRRILEGEGYVLLEAPSGLDGLAVLGKHQIDVVLATLVLPLMSGVELLRRAEKLQPGIGRLLLCSEEDTAVAGLRLHGGEADRFLDRPCAPYDLTQAVRAAARLRAAVAVHEAGAGGAVVDLERKR